MTDPFAEFDAPGSDAEPPPQPQSQPLDREDESEQPAEPVAHKRRRRWPGFWSFGVALGMAAVTAVAVGYASNGDPITALTLTVSALGLSGIAIVLGLVSIFGRFARPWGIAGLVIGVVVNPVALLYGFSAIGLY